MIQSVPFFIKRAASHPANVVSAPLHFKKNQKHPDTDAVAADVSDWIDETHEQNLLNLGRLVIQVI